MVPGAIQPRFACDAMLIKLARYLRVLGYDARWDLDAPIADYLERADHEQRIFLTRSQRLEHQRRLPQRFMLIASDDPVEQLRQVVRSLELDPHAHLFTRCIRCNVELAVIEKNAELAARVPARTFEAYSQFFTCPCCATVFWKGAHVRNTCRKLGLD